MVATASIALTALHPGFVFGRNWSMKRARAALSGPSAVAKMESEFEMGGASPAAEAVVVDRK